MAYVRVRWGHDVWNCRPWKSSVFRHVSASRLRDTYLQVSIRRSDLVEKSISGYIWHKSFIQTVKSSFFKQIIVNQSFYGAPPHLVFFYFKEKFCVLAHIGKSLARYLSSSVYTAFRPCQKKYISGYIWHKSFIQTVNCSFLLQIIACRSLSSGKVVCFGTRFQVACLDRVYLCQKNVIFRLCLLQKMGLKRVSPVPFDKKTVNFDWMAKIISLLINVHFSVKVINCKMLVSAVSANILPSLV